MLIMESPFQKYKINLYIVFCDFCLDLYFV